MNFKKAKKIAQRNGCVFEKSKKTGYQFCLKNKQGTEVHFADMNQAIPYLDELEEYGTF